MEKTYLLKIEDLTDKAEGIGRIDGKVCFVPNTLPGDEVEVEIVKDKGSFFKGRKVGGNPLICGGAPLLRMPYGEQLLWKEKHVRSCLERIAKLENPKINPIVGMENPYNYRNKGEFKVDGTLPYCNTNCKECPIQSKKCMAVLESFRNDPRKNATDIVIRTNSDDEVLAYTIQESGFELLYAGNKVMRDHIGDIQIEVDAFSFYQVNSVQCEKLYSLVKSYVPKDSFMLDLYCGAGTIGLFCSDICSKVIGVEVVHEAIIQANRNAIINGIVNTTFIEGKAEEVVSEKLQGVKSNIVVVDPPRAGCKESLLDTIKTIGPERLVYVSCDPATLARDIALLEQRGYRFIEATPFDMFPHTVHVETICLMTRK